MVTILMNDFPYLKYALIGEAGSGWERLGIAP
jgi:hypothetical protein